MAVGILAVPGSAAAVDICGEAPAPVPEIAGGVEPWWTPDSMPAEPERQTDGGPLNYPGTTWTAGMNWHTVVDGCTDRLSPSVSFFDPILKLAWDFHEWLVNAILMVVYAALSEEILSFITDSVSGFIDGLKDSIWRPLLPSIVLLGACYLAWVGLVKKSATMTAESATWMVLSTALGIWVMAAPSTFYGLTVAVANAGSAGASTLISKSIGGTGGYECLPRDIAEMQWGEETPAEHSVRLYRDTVWQTLLCEPWKQGQFGSGQEAELAAEEYGNQTLRAQTMIVDDDGSDREALIEAQQDAWTEIASDLSESHPSAHATFVGQKQSDRVNAVISALVADLILGLFIGAVAAGVTVLRVTILLLLMLSPVVFVVGVHPGFGRRIVFQWLQLMGGAAFKMATLLAFMGIVLILYRSVLGTPLPWIIQVLIQGMLAAGIILLWRKFKTFLAANGDKIGGRVGKMVQSVGQDRSMSHGTGASYLQWNLRMQRKFKGGAKKAGLAGAMLASGGAGQIGSMLGGLGGLGRGAPQAPPNAGGPPPAAAPPGAGGPGAGAPGGPGAGGPNAGGGPLRGDLAPEPPRSGAGAAGAAAAGGGPPAGSGRRGDPGGAPPLPLGGSPGSGSGAAAPRPPAPLPAPRRTAPPPPTRETVRQRHTVDVEQDVEVRPATGGQRPLRGRVLRSALGTPASAPPPEPPPTRRRRWGSWDR